MRDIFIVSGFNVSGFYGSKFKLAVKCVLSISPQQGDVRRTEGFKYLFIKALSVSFPL